MANGLFHRLIGVVLIAVLGTALLSPALAQPTPTSREWIDAETADARLAAHRAALDARYGPMSDAFGENAGATLQAAFDQRSVYDGAMGYVGSWSGSLYVDWVNVVRNFYSRHADALEQSRRSIESNGFARAEDLAYVDRGMQDWLEAEPAVSEAMHAAVELSADIALHLGNRMRVTDDPRYWDIDTPPDVSAALRAEADRHQALADAVAAREPALKLELQAASGRVLFAAVEGYRSPIDPLPPAPVDWGALEPDAELLDEIAGFNDSCLLEISDPPPAERPPAEAAATWDEYNKAGDAFGSIQEKYASASPEQKPALRAELRDLLGSVARAIAGRLALPEDDDPELTSRMQQLFEGASNYAGEIRDDQAAGATLSDYAAGYLPKFPENSAASAHSRQWQQQLQELRRHEDRFNDLRGWQAVADWRAEKDRLLVRLMMAEEEIAWEAVTTPYTEAEIRMLQQPFSNMAAARERLAQLAETSPELERLYQLLDEYEAELIRVQHLVAGNKGDIRYLGLLAAGNAMCHNAIDELEGQNDAAKQEIAKLMQGVRDGFVELIHSRRKRGMEAVRAAQRAEAERTGQPAGPPFRIHRPVMGSGGVGEALAERVQQLVSGGFPLGAGRDFAEAVIERDDAWSVPLDSAELDRLIR